MEPESSVPVSFQPSGETFRLDLDEATAARLDIADGNVYEVEATEGEIHLRLIQKSTPAVSE